MEKPVIYIVDNDPDILEAISGLLRSAGYATRLFRSGIDLLRDDEFESAGCLLLENKLPEMTGIEIHQELMQRGSDTPVIFLSGDSCYADIVTAMKNGATNYLEKPFALDNLVEHVDAAVEDGNHKRNHRQHREQIDGKIDGLTAREHEIYQLIVAGNTNKMVSQTLGISVSTVEFHRANMRKKLGVNTLAELISMANSHSH